MASPLFRSGPVAAPADFDKGFSQHVSVERQAFCKASRLALSALIEGDVETVGTPSVYLGVTKYVVFHRPIFGVPARMGLEQTRENGLGYLSDVVHATTLPARG